MANENNLKSGKKTEFRSGEEAVENGRKGGIASGVSRRRKKTLHELAKTIAANPASAKDKTKLKKLGIEEEDATNNALVVSSVFSSAVKGNMKAVDKWEQFTAETGADNQTWDIPAKVVGKDFVDLIRNIKPNVAYVLEGGRGSLKSSIISIICVWVLKNYPDINACITRQVGNTIKDSVFSQMKWAINILGMADEFEYTTHPAEITYKQTGQKIYFRGLDDETKLKSIKPEKGYIGFLWKEEKDQMKGPEQERSVNQSVLRGGDIAFDFSSYNPPKSKDNWVNKQKLVPDPNRIIHHSCYLDAPPEWLGTKFLTDAEHLKEVNPEAYENEYLGVPNGNGGNVFDFVEIRTITDDEIKEFDQIYQGADWGWFPDPFQFVRLNYDPNREVITFIDEYRANKQPNEQTGQWIIDHDYLDFETTCDSAEKKSTRDFRNMGIPAVNAKKGPGSVEYSMKWLAGKKIVIDPERTPNVYQEFTNYQYDRDKDGNVISGYPDADNHAIDATRYALERVWRRSWSHA